MSEPPTTDAEPSKLSVTTGTDNFADEPEDWSQVHKVLTRDLKRLETQVRALKRRAWPVPFAAALASAGLSLCGTGAVPVGDYYTSSPRPTVGPSLMDWVLLVGGGIAVIVAGVWMLVARKHFRTDVDAVVEEVKTLRYGEAGAD